MTLEWNTDQTVTLNPAPKRLRKLTGTRFATVLGLNPWATDFQAWCEITGAHRAPFEESIYTNAGKVIEPKQIQYVRDNFDLPELIDPVMEYGPEPFKTTYGNFFNDNVFGGMWDAINRDEFGNVDLVVECKTTKRVQDWEDDVPEYYALQASLYAWLLDCDNVMMVVSFLKDEDYEHPEDFVCDDENTAVIEFSVSERYEDFFDDYVLPANDWYLEYAKTGNSPQYDERKDHEYLEPMRNTSINPTSDVDALLNELADLQHEIDIVEGTIKDKVKRTKNIKDQLKRLCQERIGDDKTATIENDHVKCTLARGISTSLNIEAMKEDGVYDEIAASYEEEKITDRFTVKVRK